MKYQIGDRVVLKPAGLRREEKDWDSFTQTMIKQLKGTDRVVEITSVNSTGYRVKWPARSYGAEIGSDEILGYAFEYGEEIEVKQTDGWTTDKFGGYCPGSTQGEFIGTGGMSYTDARPIRKVEITVERRLYKDGKDITDTISETSKKELLGE